MTATNALGSAAASSAQLGPILPNPAHIRAALTKVLTQRGKNGKLRTLVRRRGYTCSFAAPSAGTLLLSWYQVPKGARISRPKPVLIATVHLTFTTARTAKLTIKLTAKGKQRLKTTRRLKLTAKGTSTPKGGTATSKTATFTLPR